MSNQLLNKYAEIISSLKASNGIKVVSVEEINDNKVFLRLKDSFESYFSEISESRLPLTILMDEIFTAVEMKGGYKQPSGYPKSTGGPNSRYFFKLVKDLPAQFLFPILEYTDFKNSLETGKDFTQEQEYTIHRARTRHNSALKRVSETMGIPALTGHVPRHTLANHMSYMGNSEEDIRQVLGHANVRTTKIYLRERHGFSGSFDIMKRFHQVKM